MTFKDFAENVFLPHHVISPARTRELGYCIRGRLNPVCGHLALADISRERIRAWVAVEAPDANPRRYAAGRSTSPRTPRWRWTTSRQTPHWVSNRRRSRRAGSVSSTTTACRGASPTRGWLCDG
jgi:hypothetical protein